VNIGYRLSAFGFLACDEPKISGNFGFKDQWLALEWVRDNIACFGGCLHVKLAVFRRLILLRWIGDPDNVQIMGLSAGAHSVHQILHHASRLPKGLKAPFRSAVLMSNALVSVPTIFCSYILFTLSLDLSLKPAVNCALSSRHFVGPLNLIPKILTCLML